MVQKMREAIGDNDLDYIFQNISSEALLEITGTHITNNR